MKKIAYIGAIGVLGVITTEFGVIGILPQIAETYDISIEKAGTLLSGFAMVIACTGPIVTLLTSGFNQKKLMLYAMSLFFISNLISIFAPPFWLLMLVRLLPAFLQPAYMATAVAVAVSFSKEKNKNEMMGIVFSGISIAMVTAVPLASWIASEFAFQYAYFVGLIVSFIAMVSIYIGLPNMPKRVKQSYGSQLQILKRPTFIMSTLMNLFKIAAWFATYSYFAEYLNKVKQMDATNVSYMLLLFGVLGVISSFIAGKFLSINLKTTTLFFLSGTVIIPVLLQFTGGYTWGTILLIAAWGFMYAPCFLITTTYMISAAPDAVEFANSLQISFGNLGVVLGTTIGGWVISRFGIQFTPWITLGLGLLAFVMIWIRDVMEKRKSTAILRNEDSDDALKLVNCSGQGT